MDMGVGGGDDDNFTLGGVEDDDKQQSIIKMRHLCQSSILLSHKNYVSDIVFIPGSVNDKKLKSDGKSVFCMTCSEDGIVNFWDTRQTSKEALNGVKEYIWKPTLTINVFR